MWSDRETNQDCLGYTSYVTVVANVCTHPELAPLTLGIFGTWGSGKTSLMRMLQSHIDTEAEATAKTASTTDRGKQPRTLTLWYNAWQYEGREEAQSALIHAILTALQRKRSLGTEALAQLKKLKDGASVLKLGKFIMKSVITMTPNVEEFLDIFSDESDKLADTMERFEGDFAELVKAANLERIIVFIDDLDRCSAAKVIETFETIKLFLNTPFCTFVIGADAAKIEHAVGEVYGIADGKRQKEYLEKIVQVPFHIPEQDLGDIACYVGMLIIGRHLNENGRAVLAQARPSLYSADGTKVAPFYDWPVKNRAIFSVDAEAVVTELEGVLPYVPILGRGLRGNPRHIKRFLNVLALRRALAEANALEYKPELLVKLAVLEYVDEEFFGMLVEDVDPATGHSGLLEEVHKAAADSSVTPESELVKRVLSSPWRLQYLVDDPSLTGTVDLNPYLFLAQTSLSKQRAAALMPAEEEVTKLAAAIASTDPVPSKAAARRAATKEPAVAATVVRTLLNQLPTVENIASQTHIFTGLAEICRVHKDLYSIAVKAIEQAGTLKEAPALAASTLVSAAGAAGITIPAGLGERLRSASPLVRALTKPANRGGEGS